MEIRAIRKLMLGFALVLVLVGGAFINANAACSFGCSPNISLSTCPGNCPAVTQQPAQATCQGAYSYGPTVPQYFGYGGF